jgi:probable HAF family extracellular repeat protein
MSNLNELIVADSGWVLKEARGINDNGQIVGWGITNNQEHAFLLTPNVPPSVSITDPANSSTFDAPVNIEITASASDSDGTVTKVEFYHGATKIGEDSVSAYAITWEDAYAGSFALTAVATDNFGAKSTSAVVNITVDLPAKASLKFWLKTETLSALADGAAVSTWADSSGQANDASQSNGSFRPNYWTNQVNGRPIVRFDGMNDGLDLPGFLSSATQAEVFIIHKALQALPGADKGFWHIGNANTFTGYPVYGGSIYDNFGNNSLRGTGIPNQPIDQFHLYNVLSKSGEWTSRINGLIHYSSGNNTVAFTGSPTLGKSFYSFGGDIAEVLIYTGTLTPAQRASVGAYLESRYALVASAPSAPSSLAAQALSATQVSLNWSFTLGSASTRFLIERKTGSGGTYAQIARRPVLLRSGPPWKYTRDL